MVQDVKMCVSRADAHIVGNDNKEVQTNVGLEGAGNDGSATNEN